MAGKVIILCAPSGSGKTTLAKYLLSIKELDLKFSVSATTRKKRDGEKDGLDYNFLSIDEFKNRIYNNEFVEFEEVYDNIFYGTLKSEIKSLIINYNIIFDVDVVGALSLKQYFSSNSLTVFINPPSIGELENRLRRRKNNFEEDLIERLDKAEKEMKMKDKFDKIIINNDLNKSKDEIFSIVKDFLNK
tara:strand:- start:1688 stop:2254 length:567 start_codon:yes stop_codon:yes gene_type:complete